MGSTPISRAIIGSDVAITVESVFSMKRAVAMIRGRRREGRMSCGINAMAESCKPNRRNLHRSIRNTALRGLRVRNALRKLKRVLRTLANLRSRRSPIRSPLDSRSWPWPALSISSSKASPSMTCCCGPGRSEVLPGDVDIATRLTTTISLNLPIVASAMDTVTEAGWPSPWRRTAASASSTAIWNPTSRPSRCASSSATNPAW